MPQSLDSWPTVAIGLFAAVAAFLVPFTGFVKTMLDYRLEVRKSEAQKPQVARDLASGAGSNQVFDSMALSDLTATVKGLTAAIAADTASDEIHQATQVSGLLERVVKALDERDAKPGSHPHGRR